MTLPPSSALPAESDVDAWEGEAHKFDEVGPALYPEDRKTGNSVEPISGAVVLTLPELLSATLPTREPLIVSGLEPVVRRRDQVLLYAPRGLGKTWIGLSLAVMLAEERPWTRWRASRPFRGLYIDGEMPGGMLQDRARCLAGDATRPNLRFLIADTQDRPVPSFASIEGQDFIEPHLEGAEFLFLDHVSSLFGRMAENDAEAWQPAQDWLLELRRRGITVFLIHHAGRSGNQRGTTKREDVADLILALRHPADYIPEHGLRAELHFEKARGVMGKAVEPFEVRLHVNGGVASWDSCEPAAETFGKVVDLLRAGKSLRSIELETGIPKSSVQRLASRARERGLL